MKSRVRHIHFTGIGGAGMSAIAEVLHHQGFVVTGTDAAQSEATQRLASLGVAVHIGHAAAHIAGAQAVVASTAVAQDNPELVAARAQHIPVLARAELLAELMRFKTGIAIAGTHGKTTTTALVACVLSEAGVDPTFVIGGKLLTPRSSPAASGIQAATVSLGQPGEDRHNTGANARLGKGEHIVVEADESDASFLLLSPLISVITNIDADHMETYGHSMARLHTAFADFVARLPFYGRAIVCGDDAGVQAVLPRLQRPVFTYGLNVGNDVRALDVQALPGGRMLFAVQRPAPLPLLQLTLNLAGTHNVLNALAAVTVAMDLQLPDVAIARALAGFAGVGRRFERQDNLPSHDGGHFTLVDDYGHHPVEMAAVLQAARGAFPGQRLLVAFQPHRYSRTRDCFAEFVDVLLRFDAVLLTEVYSAGEAPIAGADGAALFAALHSATAQRAKSGNTAPRWVPRVEGLAGAIAELARDGDVVITLGAGSIGEVPQALHEWLNTTGVAA